MIIFSQALTCGSPLSPAACSFSFMSATLAAVALFLAPFLPLLGGTFFLDSDIKIRDVTIDKNILHM